MFFEDWSQLHYLADMNLFNFGSIFKIDSESSVVRSTVFSKQSFPIEFF